jgi:hypothetical protein
LEPELVNDTVHGSLADPEVALSEFLSDDFGAGFGIEEAVADDLTNEFLGAPVVGFWTSFGTEESLAAILKKERSDLEVTLAAKAEFSSGTVNPFRAAFAFDEHGQFSGDLIGFGNRKSAGFTLDVFFGKLERNHGGFSSAELSAKIVYLNMAQMYSGPKKNRSSKAGLF